VVEGSRKHGPFDTRWLSASRNLSDGVPTPPYFRAADADEVLDWEGFSKRYFPGRRRHDMEAVTAYAKYKQGRELRTTPARLSAVPTEHVELGPEEEGTRRLLAAMAADQV
jgi:hypothetical protein